MLVVWICALASASEAVDKEQEGPSFFAGSYGRVQVSSDLEGGGGDPVRVATYAPRLELDPYLELDLGWVAPLETGAEFTVVVTPALSGELFHYSGEWGGEELTLRNLYVQAALPSAPLEVWAGSRMYRGDDVYLLDFWPMDEINTVGGGAFLRPGRTEIAVHAGGNRLVGEDWQVQWVEVAAPDNVTGETVLALDRQRAIASARLSHHIERGQVTLRPRLYAEVHRVPEGSRWVQDAFAEPATETLPADDGVLVGAQFSAWGWSPDAFAHAWVTYSTGLAAYGELAIPVTGFATDYRVRKAHALLVAVAGNQESDRFGFVWGGYARYFVDADGIRIDFDDRWEIVVAGRPQLFLGEHVALGLEASHQHVRPNGLNPRTDEHDVAGVTKISVLPAIQTAPGSFSRPRLHVIYTASLLGDGARAFYAPDDVRIHDGIQHYVGVGAEWWINSQRAVVPR